jgi:membrane-associated phospholipid phosphatase
MVTAISRTRREPELQPVRSVGVNVRASVTLLVGLACIEALVLVIGDVVVHYHGGGHIQGWDNTVGTWWLDHRWRLVGASKVIVRLGDPLALAVIAVLLSVLLVALTRRPRGLAPIVAYLGAEGIVLLSRELVARHRPLTAYPPLPGSVHGIHQTGFSYPSDTATAAVAVVLSVIGVACVTWHLWSPWLVGLVLAAAVATSDLVLGTNWFSDVAFGMLAGVLWSFVLTVALRDARVPFWPFDRSDPEVAFARGGSNAWRGNRAAAPSGNNLVWPVSDRPSPAHGNGSTEPSKAWETDWQR